MHPLAIHRLGDPYQVCKHTRTVYLFYFLFFFIFFYFLGWSSISFFEVLFGFLEIFGMVFVVLLVSFFFFFVFFYVYSCFRRFYIVLDVLPVDLLVVLRIIVVLWWGIFFLLAFNFFGVSCACFFFLVFLFRRSSVDLRRFLVILLEFASFFTFEVLSFSGETFFFLAFNFFRCFLCSFFFFSGVSCLGVLRWTCVVFWRFFSNLCHFLVSLYW